MPLVRNPDDIRLGIAGMVAENGHPYSWSAIVNGYNPRIMADCGYPAIPRYLAQQRPEAFGIPAAAVTHIWCDDFSQAEHVAKASRIPNIVRSPQDMVDEVDAVLIPTDIGSEHLSRAEPFVTAGVPVFIDKPLTDRLDHLAKFRAWVGEQRPIMSSSAMRYSQPFIDAKARITEVGEPRLITMTMAKDWHRYGIHALEACYLFLQPGKYRSVQCFDAQAENCRKSSIVHVTHGSGTQLVLAVIDDMGGGFGTLNVHGTTGHVTACFGSSFQAFKAQICDFVSYLRTGVRPFPFEQTIELVAMVIAGIESQDHGGKLIEINDVLMRMNAMEAGVTKGNCSGAVGDVGARTKTTNGGNWASFRD